MSVYNIESPEFLKNMDVDQLKDLAEDIRSFLIQSISRTGGHLSSNLGIVELTIAMHKVFDSPNDKFLFDVGHQSYVHKILTGRANRFASLRQYNGLSGFQKRSESEHDFWEAGHSSTALSAALGMAIARDLKKEKHEIIAVVGDGALTGGEALEALNDIGSKKKKVIIIFNDNNMSISRNHSAMEKRITDIRTSNTYRHIKHDIKGQLKNTAGGNSFLHSLQNVRDNLKHGIVKAPLFDAFGLDYIGPIDGHDFPSLIKALQTAKEHEGPVVLHVNTVKGKGYKPAEQDKVGNWHGVGPFNPETGRFLMKLPENQKNWSQVISDTLLDLAGKNENIVAITPAMCNGSKLGEFAKSYPDRFFDCGIAEEHAMTMAAGMAQAGLHPFLSIYSSFLQRAYDQVLHDVARMDLPVVVGIDRAGLVGEDGDTHQGVFDISFLHSIPNVIHCQPKDANEARNLLYTGFSQKHPFFIRYPRGSVKKAKNEPYKKIEIGTWTKEEIGNPKQIVITYGPDVDRLVEKAKTNNLNLIVVNARFFKPMDTKMLKELFDMNLPITVYETDIKAGGLSSAILEFANDYSARQIDIVGIEDHFVSQGSLRMLRRQEGIDLDALIERLEAYGKNSAG